MLNLPNESEEITDYGWELKDGIPNAIPVFAKCDPAPPGLIGVIRCQRKADIRNISLKPAVATNNIFQNEISLD